MIKYWILILVVFLTACGNTAEPTPTSTNASKPPTSTPLPTVTFTPPPPQLLPMTPAEFEPAECPFHPPERLDVECGYVAVPQDYGNPADGTIRLAVALYHSTSDSPAPDPLIYLHGGPGGEALKSIARYYAFFIDAVVKERDLILFDQRGSGLSEPDLDCWEFTVLFMLDLAERFSDQERIERYTQALSLCRDHLVDDGVNLAAYTSAASAADVQAIVSALGYEQVNLYGVSYGTRLAQTVMRDYPALVRSAVLDSVVPIQIEVYNQVLAEGYDPLDRLFATCRDDPACNAAYPDLENVFEQLTAQLDAQPAIIEVNNPLNGRTHDVPINGSGLTNAALWALRWPDYAAFVPQSICQASDGEYTALGLALALPLTMVEDWSIGVMVSTICHEHVFATTPQALEAELAAFPSAAAFGLSTVDVTGETLAALCQAWGAAPFDPRDSQPLVSDIPTLILAGEYDPTTPPVFAERVAQHLNHAYFFEFPGRGHVPSLDKETNCPLTLVQAFLSDPANKPDNACISQMPALNFAVAFQHGQSIELATFISDEYGVSSVIPIGWKSIGSGFYNRHAFIADPTQMGIQSAAVSTEEWLQWLDEKFQSAGFDQEPGFIDQRPINGLLWRFYTTEFKGNPVDIALAEGERLTFLVVLLSMPQEHDALYKAVFVPVLDELMPVKKLP